MSGAAKPASIAPAWVAVDWGTTTLRAWAIDASGEVIRETVSPSGMGQVAAGGFEAALLAAIGHWDLALATPVIACGMVGARQGWAEAAYVAIPCPPLSGRHTRVGCDDPRLDVAIVPGLSQNRPPDVMRGEETQIAGFLSLNKAFDGVVCLPGSHSKWVRISAGEVVSFQTAMTGELFAALSEGTVLRHSATGGHWDATAFAEAVSDAISRPEAMATRLFGIRARDLLEGTDPGRARARLSGLLIGAELAATRAYWLGMQVALIGERTLCDAYGEALAAQGVEAIRTRADGVTLAGLKAARRAGREESTWTGN